MKRTLVAFLIPAALAVAAQPASAAMLDTGWSGAGNGTTKLVSDGAGADPQFTYDAVGAFGGSWTFRTTAASTRSVPVAYDVSGFYGWYEVQTKLARFVIRNGTTILNETLAAEGPVNCCSAPSGGFDYQGTKTFEVQKGDVYGFTMSGSHYTASPEMTGTFLVHEVDSTPPTVTSTVTGRQGTNGYYTGPVSVKWAATDPDSRIVASTGCADTSVSEDTAGRTIACAATSRGGTTTKSVTIKLDATAPELTVPAAVALQATTAGGAVVDYDASATDKLDPAPSVACTPAAGSVFPVGTTSVSCTATDAAGNATTKNFDALVVAAPPVAPAARPSLKTINPVLAFRFTINRSRTRLVALKVKNVPAGATVTVTCKGNSCPKSLKGKGLALQSKTSSVSLAALIKAPLRNGTTINVVITSPGARTAVKTLVVRKGKPPVVR